MQKLLHRPELIAHKFYLNIEPAAYFCVYRALRTRALDLAQQQRFQASSYAKLPLVQLANNKALSLDDVQFNFRHTRV